MGIMVLIGHFLVYYGIDRNYIGLTFFGRMMFGIFSAGLFSINFILIH